MVRLTLSRGDLFSVGALSLAWIGIWAAWIPHKAAGLTQNALHLAEWATFLPAVRVGNMTEIPEMLRLAVSLASVALAVGAGALNRAWLRWVVRAIAVLAGLFMLPPYPEVFQLWWSESYGLRFIAAAAAWVGVAACVLTDHLPSQARRGVVIALCLSAAGLGTWSFWSLRAPFEAHYHMSISPGWGALAFVGGLSATVVLQGIVIGRHAQRTSMRKAIMGM